MQTKIFSYDKLLFFFDVKLTGGFSGIITVVCLYLGIVGRVNRGILFFIALIAFYTFWNSFIGKCNTQQVKISETTLSFESLGREDSYKIDEIKKIRVREFPTGGKMYIRINDYNLLKGRYWVQFKKFNDGQDLMRQILDIEYKIHPETLKARARRVNTQYLELEKKRGQ